MPDVKTPLRPDTTALVVSLTTFRLQISAKVAPPASQPTDPDSEIHTACLLCICQILQKAALFRLEEEQAISP
jgi:hypothetical protein